MLELTGDASPTPPTFLKDAAGANGERRATVETEMTEGTEKIEEVVSIGEPAKKGGLLGSTAGKMMNAAAARTAATS